MTRTRFIISLIGASLLLAAANPALAAGPKVKTPGHGQVNLSAHPKTTGKPGSPSPDAQIQGPTCNLFLAPTISVVHPTTPPGFPFSNGQIVFSDYSSCNAQVPTMVDSAQLTGPVGNFTSVSVVGQPSITIMQMSSFLPTGIYSIFEDVTIALPAGFFWNEPVPANCVTSEGDTVITCGDVFTGIDV